MAILRRLAGQKEKGVKVAEEKKSKGMRNHELLAADFVEGAKMGFFGFEEKQFSNLLAWLAVEFATGMKFCFADCESLALVTRLLTSRKSGKGNWGWEILRSLGFAVKMAGDLSVSW